MSQFFNQNQNNNNNGSVFGTIGSIIGVLMILSAVGNTGRTAGTAAAIRNVSNNASIKDTKPERTAITKDSWEEQRQKLLDQLHKTEPILTLAEPIRFRPIRIEWDKLESSTIEIKRARRFALPELFEDNVILERHIPHLEESQIVHDDDFYMQPNEIIRSDLSSLLMRDKISTKRIPTKYKMLSDIGIENYWDVYSEYQGVLLHINPVFRSVAKSKIQKKYSYDDDNLIISATQDISDSLQVDETDFSSINIAEENVINEFNNNVYEHDIIFTDLEKYDVTPQPQIQNIPKNVNTVIPDKIISW